MESVAHFTLRNNILIDYTSVWLRENLTNELELFYCPKCRYPLLQYQGDIVTLLPGTSQSRLPIVVQCRSCSHKYMFHFIVRKC